MLFILLSLNSYLVLFDNIIKLAFKEENKLLIDQEEMIIRSIFMSFILFFTEILILIILNKKFILIILTYILLVYIITSKLKHKNMKLFFELNHYIFDITILIRPFILSHFFINLLKIK